MDETKNMTLEEEVFEVACAAKRCMNYAEPGYFYCNHHLVYAVTPLPDHLVDAKRALENVGEVLMSNKFEWIVDEPGKIILSGTPIYIDTEIVSRGLFYRAHYGAATLLSDTNLAVVKNGAEQKAVELIEVGLIEDPRVDPADVEPRGKISICDRVRCVKTKGMFESGGIGEVTMIADGTPLRVWVRYIGTDGKRYEQPIPVENLERLPE